MIQIHKFLLDKANTDNANLPVQFLETGDRRADIFNYLKDLFQGAPRKI
jgi:hypothetical protein